MIVHEGHTALVWSVAFSPDGKSVVSGSHDNDIRMWEAHSPYRIGRPLRGHSHYVYSVSYSPLGNLIASGCWDKTIRLWDTSTGQQSGEALEGNSPFLSVAFSPDTRLIASGCGGLYGPTADTIQLWDVQTRTSTSGPFKGHTDRVRSVSFSPDGAWLASGSDDKTIRIWDVAQETAIMEPLEGHTHWVRSADFCPNGAQIVSCSWDGTIRIWDARNRGAVGEPYKGHKGHGHIYSVAFSPGGTYVASGGDDKTVRLWDLRTGRQVDQPYEEHTSAVRSVAFSPCGQYIASGSDDCKVILRKILGGGFDPDDVGPQIVTGQMSTQEMCVGGGSDPDDTGSHMVTGQMSTRETFEYLRRAGCVDLSSQMDTRQEAATIVSGGIFGSIWQGRLNNGAKVAIKAWQNNHLEQCDYKMLKPAGHELFDLSRMNHQNIHQLQGVIMFRDQYLGMVSEWMDNGNIREYLLKHPDADRYQLCAQVASGLEYMHSRGLVHGELKAFNVLVSSDGIARISHLESSVLSEVKSLAFLANTNSWPGTFRWTAPEILLEEVHHKTTQADVYALGMTMLEIFTGQVPYPNCRSDISVIRTVEQGTSPSRPTQLGNNHKGDKMWQLLVRCWSRNPRERPLSGYMAGALDYMSQA